MSLIHFCPWLVLLLSSLSLLNSQLSSYGFRQITCECQYVPIRQFLSLEFNCSAPDENFIRDRQTQEMALHIWEENSCLTRLPSNLCDFPGIVSMDFTRNHIAALPSLSCLKHLQYADFSHNEIQRLHADTFAGLESLCFLDLSHNGIHTIDLGVFHPGLKSLNWTNLSYNQLTTVEPWPMILSHPFCLFNASHNRISRITNKEGWKMNDRVFFNNGGIDLSNNNFTSWIADDLKAFGIRNAVDYAAFLNWGFSFSNNPWHCDCKLYGAVKLAEGGLATVGLAPYLPVECASPPKFRGKLFTDLPLSELVCNVSEACPDGCLCQDQPHQARMLVDCRGKGLQALPSTLPPGTLHLHLQNNSIWDLPPVPYLARVQELLLAHNHLVSISGQAVELLEEARLLDVSHNRLRYLPRQLQRFPPGALRVEQNPLQCRCNSSWLGQWLRDMQDAYGQTLVNLTCQLEDGRSVPVIEASEPSLNCVTWQRPVVAEALLGTGVGLVLVATLLLLLFRYELQVLWQARGCYVGTRDQQDAQDLPHHWFVSVESEDEADRHWVLHTLLPALQNLDSAPLFVPFLHLTPGGVTADETMAAIQQSRGAIVLLSRSYASSRPRSFEFSHLYKVMATKGQGPIRVIKHRDVKASSVVNGYLRAMVRLKKYVDFEDEDLMARLVGQGCVSGLL